MSEGELDRLRRERETADRAYGEALTRVDHSLPPAPDAPEARSAPPLDLQPLRTRTRILPEHPPALSGWRGRLARFVWRIVAPVFTRQQELNEAFTEQLDRESRSARESLERLDRASVAQGHYLQAVMTFNSAVIQCLQQVTPFVDTKVREVEARLEEVRLAATVAQRSALAARHEVERLRGAATGSSGSVSSGPPEVRPVAETESLGSAYVGFEDLFRGSPDDIRRRQEHYVDRFAGAIDVLDIGCGRGEFLDLLRDRGIDAHGVDVNPEMVEVCRSRGLRAERAEALDYLRRLPDATLGGLVALQVVEHLQPVTLVKLLETAFVKLRPGATILLETINAACWVAFFESYIRDITHVRPLHPDTLKFLVASAGFEQVDVHFQSPIDESGRLQRVARPDAQPALLELVDKINSNVDRLNERLFTCLDYAIVATRPRG